MMTSFLTAKNKWLIAHEEAGIEGAVCGLKGENIDHRKIEQTRFICLGGKNQ